MADRPSAKQPAPDVASDTPPGVSATDLVPPPLEGSTHGSTSFTTAAEAMRNEEVERTRVFIRMGWAVSVVAIATVPFLHTAPIMNILFIAAMVSGMMVSFWFHQAFADPQRYTQAALIKLGLTCIVNAHVAVLYYGIYTLTPVIVVMGIHFIARTEAHRTVRALSLIAGACYFILFVVIVTGAIDDPGAFASKHRLDLPTQLASGAFVLGMYLLAYTSARTFRNASLRSIEELQKATRLASQREALMEELRADLERALRPGGPGRYSDQRVGDFHLGIVLGRGAMGEVYEAVHVTSGAPAAVKLLRRELLTDPTCTARFLREAKASSALDSRHVGKVLATGDAERPYLAMERLRGQTLSEQLRERPKLTKPALVELVGQVAVGIDAAHAAGIVHRDIKPQNLFRTDDGCWKILDFGVATLIHENSGTLTQGNIVGTPHYMAPEQAQGLQVDGSADLYALGAVAYRCVTGRHAFNAPDTPTLLYIVVHKGPERPSAFTDLPTDVDRWFALALAKSPEERFATGAALAHALDQALINTLDPKLRKRADALVRKRPWQPA